MHQRGMSNARAFQSATSFQMKNIVGQLKSPNFRCRLQNGYLPNKEKVSVATREKETADN